MTTTNPKEVGGERRQRNTLRRYRRRTMGLSMAALIFGVVYLVVMAAFIVAVVFLRLW